MAITQFIIFVYSLFFIGHAVKNTISFLLLYDWFFHLVTIQFMLIISSITNFKLQLCSSWFFLHWWSSWISTLFWKWIYWINMSFILFTSSFFSYPFSFVSYCILNYHGYFVFIIPFSTHRNWQNNGYAEFYMLLQLFYIYFSARQIQEGFDWECFITTSYPHKTTRVLEKVKDDVSLWSYYSYKLYTSIPFIYEINTLLEWTTTKTVLEMKKWFSVEEIHRLLYQALYDVTLCVMFDM